MRSFTLVATALGAASLMSCNFDVKQTEGSNVSTTVTTTTVTDPWIQLPAVPGRPGAAYFTLTIEERADELMAVSTPKARVELHESRTVNGVARMSRATDLTIPKGRSLRFSPGGKHAMLFDIDPSVKAGDMIPLTFTFRHSSPVTVDVEARPVGAGHAGH